MMREDVSDWPLRASGQCKTVKMAVPVSCSSRREHAFPRMTGCRLRIAAITKLEMNVRARLVTCRRIMTIIERPRPFVGGGCSKAPRAGQRQRQRQYQRHCLSRPYPNFCLTAARLVLRHRPRLYLSPHDPSRRYQLGTRSARRRGLDSPRPTCPTRTTLSTRMCRTTST